MAEMEVIRLRERIQDLEKRLSLCEAERDGLKRQRESLRGGFEAVNFVKDLTGGQITAYQDSYDLQLPNGYRLEIKWSHLNVVSPYTRRWNWDNILGGPTRGKEYHFLVLVGEKDPEHRHKYPYRDEPYVCFLVPRCEVRSVIYTDARGKAMAALVTSLSSRKERGTAIKKFIVSTRDIESLSSLEPRVGAVQW